MKPSLLFLTNNQNGWPAEDRFVIAHLSKHFALEICHPRDCIPILPRVQGVIIRNIWPTHEYQQEWDLIKARLRNSDLTLWNPLPFKGDIEGKDYLVTLYKEGYPVIPSIDRVEEIHRLPRSDEYWIKPKKSCDGIGARKLTKRQLLKERPRGFIIQPFMKFQMEPSFFFIDNLFHHAISAKHRLFDDQITMYAHRLDELAFAELFVRWSNMPWGIQRIDAIRLESGKLLLTEVENLCPYLYALDLDPALRQSFIETIKDSVLKTFMTRSPAARVGLVDPTA